MVKDTKQIVSFEEAFDKLDIRVGRVMEVDGDGGQDYSTS